MSQLSFQTENSILKKQLEHAQEWMRAQISESEKQITSEQNMIQDVYDFFYSTGTISLPEEFIDHVISSEIAYHRLKNVIAFDGTAITSLYQKSLDSVIETYITQGYRNFVHAQGSKLSPINNPLEKALFQVIEKGYILSSGRLYQILKNIKNQHQNTGRYETYFSDYLKTNIYLKDVLLSQNWYTKYESMIEGGAFGSKRHTGIIPLSDIQTMRGYLVGNLEEKDSLFYKLIQTMEVI